jgi:hypothetical protein
MIQAYTLGDTKTMAVTKLLPEDPMRPARPQLKNTTNSEPEVNANNGTSILWLLTVSLLLLRKIF